MTLWQERSRNDTSDNCEDTIASRFERQVAAVPDKLAIVTDHISFTYRALDLEASRIAAALSSLPARHDQPVMLFMQDEAARIAAMLGMLKTGRIFIPVAPDSPQQWLTQIIEDSGTAQIIVDRSNRQVAERVATGNITVVEIDELSGSLEPFVADRAAFPDDTAAIIYTSGSTGRPKGVTINHRGSLHSGDVRYPLFELGRNDRYANLRSSGVGAVIAYNFLPLLAGGCLFPFDVRRHGLQKLTPWLVDQKISFVSFSSSLLRTWLASLPDDLRFPALRVVGVTSERLYAEDVIRISRHLEGDWRIGHSYASTEAGIIAAQVFTPSCLPDPGIVAVGRPVDGVEVCLKDEMGAPVAPGEIGEIVVRSRFLQRGYWNSPELTANVFQTDPHDSSIRIYCTGDLGRWRSDGQLEHVGRKGRRIRLRGYNIEPFQVERELTRQPGVRDAVVLLHEAAGQEPCLVGYVVAPVDASPSAMRKGLAERLPSYMVPSHIVVLESLPIARTGKIDRNALPPPYREEAQRTFRAPSNDCERDLLAIWQEVLKIPRIGIDDDFFELGGTSLQALIVFLEIEAQLGWNLSPTAIVEFPTIAQLAETIRASTSIYEHRSLTPLRASGTGSPLFLVSAGYHALFFYREMLKDLKSDRPIFGLQPPPLDGRHRIPRTIEAMAVDYVTEIRRVQPHGPYFLAGYSFGGRVSLEIAQQLVRDGERVNFLGLVDTVLHDMPFEGRPRLSEAVVLSRKIRRVNGFQELLYRGVRSIQARARYIPWALWGRLLDLWFQLGRSLPNQQRNTYYEWLRKHANRGYKAKPYAGHITMIASAGNSEQQRAHWQPLARGGLTILEVPAGHHDMVAPPHSKQLAEHFDACLSGH